MTRRGPSDELEAAKAGYESSKGEHATARQALRAPWRLSLLKRLFRPQRPKAVRREIKAKQRERHELKQQELARKTERRAAKAAFIAEKKAERERIAAVKAVRSSGKMA